MEAIIGGAPAAADLIRDGSAETFAQDVIEASHEVPVIVDFWAPWCEPCKQLGPAIERAVKAVGGAVRLVKLNVDDNQEIAAQLRVQSIPAVFAFKGGQPVDGFVGALPDSQIKSFIARLTGGGATVIDDMLETAAAAAEAGDAAGAAGVYSQVLAEDGVNTQAIAGLARCFLALGEPGQARGLLDSLDDTVAVDSHIEGARTALELAEQTSGGDAGTAELDTRLAADRNDHQARLDLAMVHFGAGRREQAVDELLEIIRRDRAWNEEAARKQLVKLFDAFGQTDPLTVETRKRLSSILFS